MSRRSTMLNVRKLIQLYLLGDIRSKNKLSQLCGLSRTAVDNVLSAIKLHDLTNDNVVTMRDQELESLIYPEKICKQNNKPILDFAYLEKELAKPNVTRMLLWREHIAQYPLGYRRSRFFELLEKHLESKKVTMRIDRKPGEKMYVDWAGDVMHIYDKITGEAKAVYLFVTCVGCSSYPYVEAFFIKEKYNFIQAHINAFHYYNALPLIIVPDNDKSAVISANKHDPVLNATYEKMADYYGLGIMPARVRTPKDKASVEKAVLDIAEREIIGGLRNESFFSLQALNKRILEILLEFSNRPFQKKFGSRKSNFLEIDLPKMRPLPNKPFEYADIHFATVNIDYHIEYDKNYYSVPHQLAKQKVKLEIFSNTLLIYHNNILIASHEKCLNQKYHYQTKTEHMPKNHLFYQSLNKEYFVKWGAKISVDVEAVMVGVFSNKVIEEQAYRGAMGIQRLYNEYGSERFKIICRIINEKELTKNYRTLKKMLETASIIETQEAVIEHTNIRGGGYYE